MTLKSLAILGISTIVPLISWSTMLGDTSKPRYKLKMITVKGENINGLLINTYDSSIALYAGSFSKWNKEKGFSPMIMPAKSIQNLEIKKKNGVYTGLLIGIGIGIMPVLVSSIFGYGQGGAYVSLVTLPLGLIIGSIVGATSRKKFMIAGNQEHFNRFKSKIH